MKHVFRALALIALFAMPASAGTKIDDPVKFVKAVYACYQVVDQKKCDHPYGESIEDQYTARLAALVALERRESGGEAGRLDWDSWVDGQDWELSKLIVTSNPVELASDRQVVIARFKNHGQQKEIHFYFENTKAGWRIDDIRSAGKPGWTLSLVLKYGAD